MAGTLLDQILASSDTSKWTGTGFGSAQANAADMAKILSQAGITDLSQFGVKQEVIPAMSGEWGSTPEQTINKYYNKATGQEIGNTYGERQQGNFWGGTYTGSGNTGYGVTFDAKGNPQFYTQGASSSDLNKDTLIPLLAMGGIALGAGGVLDGLFSGGGAEAAGAGAAGAGDVWAAEMAGAAPAAEVAAASGTGGLLSSLTPAQIANLAKAGISIAGLVGTTKALSNTGGSSGSSATPAGSLPTQGMPGYGVDYYSQLQNYYNKYLPGQPEDVTSKLASWYGVTAPTTVDKNTAATALKTASLFGGLTPDNVSQIKGLQSTDKASIYNDLINSGVSDAKARSLVEANMGAQTNTDWDYLQSLAASQSLQGGKMSPIAVQTVKDLTPAEKAVSYTDLLKAGLTDAQAQNIVNTQMGTQTPEDWKYLQNLAGVQQISSSTDPSVKVREYKDLLAQGYTDAQARGLVENAVGKQTDTDWNYLKMLAGY